MSTEHVDFDRLDDKFKGCVFRVIEMNNIYSRELFFAVQHSRPPNYQHWYASCIDYGQLGSNDEKEALALCCRLNEWSFT